MEKALQSLGLTKGEARVYLALLKKGSALAGRVTKETGIHRRTVYDALERLIEKGMVSYIIVNNKRYFEAINPERLVDIFKEKEETFMHALEELKSFYKSTKEKKETLFFRGKQSLKSVFDDQLKEGKEIWMIGKCPPANEILKFYFPRYNAKRIKNNIKLKILYDEETKKQNIKDTPLTEIRFIESPNPSPMYTYIYGNNVSIVIWSHDPIAILIRQKEIAEGFRNYFNLLWNISKE